MEDYRKTLETYRESAKADALALENMYKEYTPQIRVEKQRTDRAVLIQKHSMNARSFIGRIEKQIQDTGQEIRKKKFPLLSSVLESERLRGTIDYNTALQVTERYPTKLLRKSLEMNRTDFASALMDRLDWIGEPNAGDAVEGARFNEFKRMSEIYQEKTGTAELEKTRIDLEKVRKRAIEFQKQIEADFSLNLRTWQEYSQLLQKIRA